MLDHETANEQLESYRLKNGRAVCKDRVEALSGAAREVGLRFFEKPARYRSMLGERDVQERQQIMQALEDLSEDNKNALFTAFFPAFGSVVTYAFEMQKALPYQLGYYRKAFRAPNDSNLTLNARVTWLEHLLTITTQYDPQLELDWFASWTPYLGYGADNTLGYLFAAAIEVGHDTIFETLVASAKGEHPVGAMGRHVTRALLIANKPDGWTFIEKLLLAAQRQEGLRQVILETIDEAHPEAFARMLRLLSEEKLSRFAATVRAINVWFDFVFETGQDKKINALLEKAARFMDNPQERHVCLQQPLTAEDALDIYLALWAEAYQDAVSVVTRIKPLLNHASVDIRYVAVDILSQLHHTTAQAELAPMLNDKDLRIALRALQGINATEHTPEAIQELELFDRVEQLLLRTPKNKTLTSIVWEWTERTTNQRSVALSLLKYLGDNSIDRLMPHAKTMGSYGRREIIILINQQLTQNKHLPSHYHQALLNFVGDASSDVRSLALAIIKKITLSSEEIEQLESLLTRKAGDLRRGVISLIVNQSDEGVVASAERLLAASKAPLREAGLEILRELKTQERSVESVSSLSEAFAKKSSHTQNELTLLESLLAADAEEVTLEDGLGLFDPEGRTQPITPQDKRKRLFKRGQVFASDKSNKLFLALDNLIHEYRETPVRVEGYAENTETLLGNLRYALWRPFSNSWKNGTHVRSRNTQDIILKDIWESWWEARPAALRDGDGCTALRAYASYVAGQNPPGKGGLSEASKHLFGRIERSKLRYEQTVVAIIQWFCFKNMNDKTLDFALDAAETSLALVPDNAFEIWEEYEKEQREKERWYHRNNMRTSRLFSWFQITSLLIRTSEHTNPEHIKRYWQLLKTLDEGLNTDLRYPPDWQTALQAYKFGAANDNDIYDYLIGERDTNRNSSYVSRWVFRELNGLSGHKPAQIMEEIPQLATMVDNVRTRVLEIELKRADMPTPASLPALALRAIYGADYVFALLKGFGKNTFLRGYSYDGLSKTAVFSGLLRSSFPSESDTLEGFKEKAQAEGVSEQRLLDLAVYAPQWSAFVCHALGWEGLEEAVYWLHAHTKDTSWTVDNAVREVWNAEVAERTPLKGAELLDGAVDVAWFSRVYNALGAKRWAMLDDAAKYASGGGGHKRAQLFANALLGNVSFEELEKRIRSKRHQDSVRAVGLLPLPATVKAKKAEVLKRYTLIQEFLRGRRKFGSQRQASEKLAATIGLENLARTADYADPQRLMWAMEAEAIRDLAAGPISVTEGDVTVSLSLDALGAPELSILKKGKALKNIPAKLKKHPEIAALRDRKTDLAKQTSRMRGSLEEAMNRGDSFTTRDFAELFKHPVLKPMLTSLVFITEDNALGYPINNGKALRGVDGSEITLGKTSVRVAHPTDLLASQQWSAYQQDVIASERKQPFKQVFRELYVLTNTERDTAKRSTRYAGHQVNPRQALALLGGRGWVSVPEEGARRTFHQEGISVWLEFEEGFYTPADVDGLTLSGVVFSKRGEWRPLALEEVPARVFSEAMRDLDLVVSVAHRGGVDPEASASTVEMRSALLRETLHLMKLTNVRIERNHALIKGELGEYSIHLGSALVHRQPGGSLCIIPVHSQHRGRLFLPFADDDPKTAEVMSKVLLLAKDNQIQDPTILEQLR